MYLAFLFFFVLFLLSFYFLSPFCFAEKRSNSLVRNLVHLINFLAFLSSLASFNLRKKVYYLKALISDPHTQMLWTNVPKIVTQKIKSLGYLDSLNYNLIDKVQSRDRVTQSSSQSLRFL